MKLSAHQHHVAERHGYGYLALAASRRAHVTESGNECTPR